MERNGGGVRGWSSGAFTETNQRLMTSGARHLHRLIDSLLGSLPLFTEGGGAVCNLLLVSLCPLRL